MTAFYASRGLVGVPAAAYAAAGVLSVARGTIAVAANPVASDTYDMCFLPAGAVVIGGLVDAAILDTNAGSETLDMDLGWPANGGAGTYDAADPDGFGNFGVWKGDAFATGNINRVATNQMWLGGDALIGGIFPFFTKRTKVQFTCVATAATFAAGSMSCAIFYTVDPTLIAA